MQEVDDSHPALQLAFASTGSDLFDLALGGSGSPFGKIINIIGDKSTGKTLISTEMVAQARKKFKEKIKWYYDDAEAGYSFDSKYMYGFDIFHEDQDSSYTVDDFENSLDVQMDLLEEDEYLIYILDSLDSLASAEELARYERRKAALAKGKDPVEEGTYGTEKAKKMSSFFRILRQKIQKKKCLLIVISQVRQNIGVKFGFKHVRTGGDALNFYASQIIWLAETEKHKRKDRVIGVTVKAMITKNKVGLPFRECFINILFDYGVDNVWTNIDFLYDLKTDMGKSSKAEKLEWDGVKYSPRALITFIEKSNLEEELSKRVKDKWNAIEDSISSRNTRKKRWDTL